MNKKEAYGLFITCWECGQVKVLGRISGIITLLLAVTTYLELKHISLYWWQFILLGIFLIIIVITSGFAYRKFNLFKIEQGAIQRQNPELMEIKSDLKKLVKEIDEKRD